MKLNDKARELARLIKNSEEYRMMNTYKREIEKNKSLKRQLDSYLAKKDKIYSSLKIEEATQKISKLDREYSKTFQTPLVQSYFKSTQAFNALMQQVYKTIEAELLK